MENLNSALFLIEKFASLASTPSMDETTVKLANEQIQILLQGPVKEAIKKLTASSAGLII